MNRRRTVKNSVAKKPAKDRPIKLTPEAELLTGIQVAREQARRGEGVTAEEARRHIEAVITKVKTGRSMLIPKGMAKLRIKDLIIEGRP